MSNTIKDININIVMHYSKLNCQPSIFTSPIIGILSIARENCPVNVQALRDDQGNLGVG